MRYKRYYVLGKAIAVKKTFTVPNFRDMRCGAHVPLRKFPSCQSRTFVLFSLC